MSEKSKARIILLLGIILITGILLLAGCGSRAGFYVQQSQGGSVEEQQAEGDTGLGGAKEQDSSGGEGGARAEDTKERQTSGGDSGEPVQIYVQVCGAVAHPGVYPIAEGSRIFEAIELAGGATEDADLASLNQAEHVSDGQMIYLYAQGEQRKQQTEAQGTEADGRVNLNTADAGQLMTLPGIGRSKADSIIAWREEHGFFEAIEDIMDIEGIKEGVFQKIKDKITVGG